MQDFILFKDDNSTAFVDNFIAEKYHVARFYTCNEVTAGVYLRFVLLK